MFIAWYVGDTINVVVLVGRHSKQAELRLRDGAEVKTSKHYGPMAVNQDSTVL